MKFLVARIIIKNQPTRGSGGLNAARQDREKLRSLEMRVGTYLETSTKHNIAGIGVDKSSCNRNVKKWIGRKEKKNRSASQRISM